MKRNWDLIRDVLVEVEELNEAEFQTNDYGPLGSSSTPEKDYQALLLWKAGLIEGANASTMDGDAIIAQRLTWAGHDLLDTIRSNAVWERVKSTAKEKGIELTFDSVKAIAKVALASIISATT